MLPIIKRASTVASATVLGWLTAVTPAFAGIFGDVPDIGGATDARAGTISVIKGILNFMALVAVVIIVIAGIRLVVSQGDETAVGTGKKTILFAVIGLIVILLASAIVDFIATEIVDQI
ncbi:hypothetical protein COU80_03400 [Candidatus Peregrinibacteria bacterium CG10_big_fil_rev_8_21_14_0_10_55_24]|nr:MAG: hypothetical protein COU80_03400 [Candidatus Peregrinibacteria bacterium CG10_big_fil_rev_8_21_14_0_10_55_24]